MACSRRTAIIIGGLVVVVAIAIALTLYFTLRNESSTSTESDDAPVVSIEQGDLRGEWVDGATGDGFRYAAFRWIPYAQPPLGEWRFKEPRLPLKWKGVRDATTEGDVCFQASTSNSSLYFGSEDCLILNVFTPQLPQNDTKTLLPVIFYIHGGAFIYGSSSILQYGPDYLVSQGIVVVSINYRLNVLGFLNFENSMVPGSTALKDQILALKWVQSNIKTFGGDPKKVTVFGQSAGAVCTHWLTLLPETEGLFRAAIIMSGSALHGWGYMEINTWYAENLGKMMGANNLSETTRMVMEASPEEIYSAAQSMITLTDTIYDMPGDSVLSGTWKLSPTPQRRMNVTIGQERTIFRDAESHVLNRTVPDVPILIGTTNAEWLMVYYSTFSDCAAVQTEVNENLYNFLPLSIIPYEDTQRILGLDPAKTANYSYHHIADYLRDNYFIKADNDSCVNTPRLKEYYSEVAIQVEQARLVRLRARMSTAKTYMYKFAVKSDYNANYSEYETAWEETHAACHSDDLNYLFLNELLGTQSWNGTGLASTTLRRMVKMWANFVKYIDPTPDTDSDDPDLNGVKWEPYNVTNTTDDTYLHIGPELSMKQDCFVGEEDTKIWLDLFAKHRENKSI